MQQNRKIIDTSGAVIISASSAVGGKEFEGPLGACFDFHDPSDRFGQKTFEKSEGEMQRLVLASAMSKIGAKPENIDVLFAGDLLNQCVSSAYGLLEYDIPYFGLYGACSTAAEGLMLLPHRITPRRKGSIEILLNTAVSALQRHNGRSRDRALLLWHIRMTSNRTRSLHRWLMHSPG